MDANDSRRGRCAGDEGRSAVITLKLTDKEARAVHDELHRIYPRGVHWSAANMLPVLAVVAKLYEALDKKGGR